MVLRESTVNSERSANLCKLRKPDMILKDDRQLSGA